MKILDSITCQIENKVSLIEASAGTGKTYNIQNLFVRLIMETEFPIESILVVTFTEAATRELKSRIRSILSGINNYFNGYFADDIERIKNLANQGTIEKATKHKRIDIALQNFDKASIFTIHGFCKKMLDENVFSTSQFFNLKLQTNNEDTLYKITRDFYRLNFYNITREEYFLFSLSKINIENLVKFIRLLKNQSNYKFKKKYLDNNSLQLLNEFNLEIRKHYNRPELEKILNQETMKQNSYKPAILEKIFGAVDDFINYRHNPKLKDLLEKLTKSKIESGTKKGKSVHCLKLFSIIDSLFDNWNNIFNEYSNYKFQVFAKFFQTRLQDEKTTHGFRNFDDLVSVLQTNMVKNPRLTETICNSFKAILIDEFQDTDDLQYSIFSQMYQKSKIPVFLIGDPKQAIYSFRGGDIYVYRRVKDYITKAHGNFYTLKTNYRSTHNMVASINEMFSSLPKKWEFLNDFIIFYPVESNSQQNNKLLYKNKEVTKTLDIFLYNNANNENKSNEFAISQTVTEISKLISNQDYQISENGCSRNIVPSDITILVTKHSQARELLPKLQRANIPAVIQASGSVFDSIEAEALGLILKAIEEPKHLGYIRGALTSFLFNLDTKEIFQMNQGNSKEMEKWLLLFRNCYKKWRKSDFIETFNYLISETKLKQNLLSLENKERKITNLMHLQELIQKKETESSIGMNGIMRWYKEQLNPETRDSDEDMELRLDSDDMSIKIMTIHKSKGLEFPIVFCPFLWSQDNKIKNNTIIQYHDNDNNKIIDFESTNHEKAEKENLEESIRLAYVALTRSIYKACLFSVKNKKLSVLKYLLEPLNNIDRPEILNSLKNSKSTIIKDFVNSIHINIIECKINDYIPSKYQPEISIAQENISENIFHKKLHPSWHLNSFSSLNKHQQQIKIDYFKELDENERPAIQDEKTILDIHSFPAGAKVGSCWHAIFENISFADNIETIRQVIIEHLENHKILPPHLNESEENIYLGVLTKMVRNVLESNILPSKKLILQNIEDTHRLSELEFLFSIKKQCYQ